MTEMPAGFSVRPARNTDSPDVRELVYSVLREYGMDPDPDHADRGLNDIEAAFRNGQLELLFDADAVLVGTVGILKVDETTCELTKMFLLPAQRGRGLGRYLLERAIRFARAQGYRTIELETDAVLKDAVRLYQQNGFRQTDKPNATSRCHIVMAREI